MRLYTTLICVICLTGCSQTQQLNTPSSRPTTLIATNSAPATSIATVESELRTFAETWKGVPHLDGGNSRSGIDAPGLVMVIADQVLGLSLPHSTARQLGFGEEIQRTALVPGDILFFRPTSMPRHVGVYLGSQEFLHAWPGEGVSIARLDESYWNGAYWIGRRVLGIQISETDIDTTSEDPQTRPSKRRVGW
ncbi:MAG: NlpC/P60 family protein [Bacteroidetes bacterium]|nr:NlpC/P60 family protein [Bacteroidota bacterium]